MEMSVTDREWVKTTITAPATSLAAISGVRAAFVTHEGKPLDADWRDAELVDGRIRILVGPGGQLELPAATYRMWGEITADPELVRRPAGLVKITP